MTTKLPPNTIRLWHQDTPTGHDLYPVVLGERIPRTQTATWALRVVDGPTSADSEQLMSSWTQDDYSGGFGIEDANETTDSTRYAFGIIDSRRPKHLVLPPLTTEAPLPWTPDQLTSTVLTAWFKADAITGLTDGVTLSGGWNDSSGNARHATNGTDADRPLYQTADLNALPGVEFVSTDDLATTLSASSHDETILAVIDVDSLAAVRTILGDQATTGRALQVETTGAITIAKTGTGALGTSTATISINTPSIVGATTGAATVVTHVNGVDESDAHAVTFAASQSSSIGTANGTANPFDGMIYEIVVCTTLSTENRERVEGYLAHKWGITARLASDHPYKTNYPTATSGVGSFWPLGDVGTQFYAGTSTGIYGWDATNNKFYVTTNHWPASFTPQAKGVQFGGGLFIPGGAAGFVRLSEATAATGTLTVGSNTGITAVRFGLHDGKLWAIDTANQLWMLTTVGSALGATTTANWGKTDAVGGTDGLNMQDTFGNDFILDTSLTPTRLINYVNAAQEETLWCITRGKGAYLMNPDEPRWIKSSVKEGAHPDWGYAAEVFRDGEDLWIAGGGLDITRFTTANVEVPLSGPSKDQGVPPQYWGTLVDLCAERSTLYGLVSSGTSLAAGAPASEWVLQQTGSEFNGLALSAPGQVAVDSTGRVLIADIGNSRLVILTSTGIYSTGVTGLTGIRGVCRDSSDNIYVAFGGVASGFQLAKYSSALALQWTQTLGTSLGDPEGHVATDSTHVYAVDRSGNYIHKRLCSTGAAVTTWGTTGSGNDNYMTPYGITVTGSEVYVVDQGNSRVKVTNTTGTYAREWAINASARGIAPDASGDIWVCEYANNQLRRFSNAGVEQTTIAQSTPSGIGITASTDILWVSSGQNNVNEWDEESVADDAVASKAWLAGYSGTAWCGLWESSTSITPTWMQLATVGDHALWWGDTDGVAYYQLVPPPFFNPVARLTLQVYPFAATGWLTSVRYDANMTGWDKVASHFFAMCDYAAADVYVDVSYRTDADAFDAITDANRLDPPWTSWKRIDHTGRTIAWFDDETTDTRSGMPRREGLSYQWIQFKFAFARGSDTYKSPIWSWHSLHHFPVPQDSASFVLTIPLAVERLYNRSVDEVAETLMELQTHRGMVWLQISDPRPSNPEQQVYFRGKVTQVKSEFRAGAKNNLVEVLVLNFVELGASSNEHTTEAP
jgi:hypothetical protein